MEHDPYENEEDFILRKRHPIVKVIALITALALMFLSIQAYLYLIRPEPVDIPSLAEVEEFLGPALDQPFSSHRPEEVRQVIDEIRSNIKQVANFIAARSCREADRVCQSKALYYFVRDEISYVPDDRFHDQLENPLTVLKTGGADCEDMSVLLIALQKAIGNRTRLVFIPGHAYAQVSIPGYRDGQWMNMEGTCDNCQFGELPNQHAIQPKDFHEI
ncbi:MAG: transglutaminase domain-containing protein [Candidatus Peregrinibacteria bacterium]|nr:transglutaminase domain-containing protein [Candidatus Peregrinibacteria bacterium]